MSETAGDPRYESLGFAGTLARLTALTGREVLVEARVGDLHGPFRLAARGVLRGPAASQDERTRLRSDGDDIEAFLLDTGGFLAVREADFVSGEWHPGHDEDQLSAQPRLNIVFTDSVLHVAVIWRRDPAPGERD